MEKIVELVAKLVVDGVLVVLGVLAVSMYVSLRRQRKFIKTRYDWLPALNYVDWKTAPEIVSEMEKIKKGRIGRGTIYADLLALEYEGLVKRRITPDMTVHRIRQRHEFQRAIGRTRKRVKTSGKVTESSAPVLRPV